MNIIKKLLLTVLSPLLAITILLWATNTLFGSATTLNSVARNSGAYEMVAIQYRSSLADTSKVPDSYQVALQKAINSSLTAEQVEAMFQPLLVDLVSWLNQPASTEPPKLILVIQPAKAALLAKLTESGLTPAELAAAQVQLTQQIPDQLELTKAQEVTGTGASTPAPSGFEGTGTPPTQGTPGEDKKEGSDSPLGSNPTESLKSIKSIYQLAQTVTMWVTIAVVLLTLLLVWLSRRDGRAMLRRPAWQFLFAGGLTLIGWMVFNSILKPAPLTSNMETAAPQLIIGVLRELYNIAVVYGLAVFVVGLILYGLSYLIHPKMGVSAQPAPLRKMKR